MSQVETAGTIILSLDDDTDLLDMETFLAEECGATIRTYTDPDQAEADFYSHPEFNLVLSDLDLRRRDGDGVDFVRKIRGFNPRIPIIVMTNSVLTEGLRLRVGLAGANAVVDKNYYLQRDETTFDPYFTVILDAGNLLKRMYIKANGNKPQVPEELVTMEKNSKGKFYILYSD